MTSPSDPRRVPLTRRQFVRRAAAVGAGAAAAPSLLSVLNAGRAGASGEGGSLYFENWPAYIDPTEDGAIGTVDRFIEATGIDMKYTEAYNDNDEYFAKIQPILGRGNAIEPDLIAPTSWLAGRLINLGWVDELPLDQVPNAANLREDLQNPPWDPDGKFSLPWQGGFAGIAYNLDVTGRELNSVDDLFAPEFQGKIGMLTEMRDTIGLIMLSLGIDITSISSFDEAAPAFDKLEEAKNSGQIRQFTGNDYLDDLGSGNFAACVGWSGDVVQLSIDNPAVRFVIPEEGGTSWADTMVIPKGSPNADSVAAWMNFVYDPVQAAQITAWVQYVSPVAGVRDELAKLDPDLADNPLLFPDDETLARTYQFAQLSDDVETAFDARFSEIVGA